MLFSYSRNTDNVTLSAAWNYQMTHFNLVTRRLQNIAYTLNIIFVSHYDSEWIRARSLLLRDTKNDVDK